MTKGVTNARQKQRHNEAKEEKEQRIQEEVTWVEDYFMSIRQLCPWSLKYWMESRILHIKEPNGCELTWCAAFTGNPEPGKEHKKHEAILFEYNKNTSVDTLFAITEVIEQKYPQLIAFWSHPIEKDQNTPVPCCIVQDRATLTDLRKKVGYTDD